MWAKSPNKTTKSYYDFLVKIHQKVYNDNMSFSSTAKDA